MTPTVTAPPTDLLRISDLDAAQLQALLELARLMKQDQHRHDFVHELEGETVALFFEKPSTRTRVSFAAAAERLGMAPLVLRPDDLQLGRGEPVADTARSLSGYTAAIVVRTFAQALVEEIAAAATVPVINALTDEHHPCQALADLLTIRERLGALEGIRVAFVGSGTNVANSLVEAGALSGLEVIVASPAGYGPSVPGAVVVDDPREAVSGADVVYTDVWVSMGEEAEQEQRVRALTRFQVNAELMKLAKPEAIFLHCLPAHRGEEVTAEVIDGPQSAVWQQADNRLPTEEALLLALITKDWPR
ncbi:MAG: ornithine carbamoyltransferase [Gaiellaceae bacterium]